MNIFTCKYKHYANVIGNVILFYAIESEILISE